jgi:hypothetical protein
MLLLQQHQDLIPLLAKPHNMRVNTLIPALASQQQQQQHPTRTSPNSTPADTPCDQLFHHQASAAPTDCNHISLTGGKAHASRRNSRRRLACWPKRRTQPVVFGILYPWVDTHKRPTLLNDPLTQQELLQLQLHLTGLIATRPVSNTCGATYPVCPCNIHDLPQCPSQTKAHATR